MKILIATDNYYPNVNGASYFAQRLAWQLKEQGHQVLVVAPARSSKDEIFEHEGVKIFGIKSMPLERIRAPIPFLMAASVRKAIASFNPDIVHIQSHFSVGRRVSREARRLGIPVVGTNHFMPENLVHFLKLPKVLEKLFMYIAWKHFLYTYKRLDSVTSPTEIAAGLLRKIGFPREVIAVSNGIDLNRFHPGTDGAYLKERYKIPDSQILLFVGRLDKEKNIDLILRALAVALKKVRVHLVLAGTGAESSNLKQLTAELNLNDNVAFAGFVPDNDLPNLYGMCQCFVMTGTAELQSIATMEAMATGLPVIAVNAMALPELVKNEGNGYLVEPGDVNSLAQKIILIFSSTELQKKFGAASLEQIKKHDISAVVHRFVEIYKGLIKK